MACELLTQYDLIYGFLKCVLDDTIDVDLMVYTLKCIHMIRKDN